MTPEEQAAQELVTLTDYTVRLSDNTVQHQVFICGRRVLDAFDEAHAYEMLEILRRKVMLVVRRAVQRAAALPLSSPVSEQRLLQIKERSRTFKPLLSEGDSMLSDLQRQVDFTSRVLADLSLDSPSRMQDWEAGYRAGLKAAVAVAGAVPNEVAE